MNSVNPSAPRGADIAFWIGWSVLLFLLAAYAISHLVGMWAFARAGTDEPIMFLALMWAQLYAVVVLLIPYRQRAIWAWWATWLGIAGIASVAVYGLAASRDAQAWAPIYLVTTGIMAVAQVAALPAFLGRRPRSGAGRFAARTRRPE